MLVALFLLMIIACCLVTEVRYWFLLLLEQNLVLLSFVLFRWVKWLLINDVLYFCLPFSSLCIFLPFFFQNSIQLFSNFFPQSHFIHSYRLLTLIPQHSIPPYPLINHLRNPSQFRTPINLNLFLYLSHNKTNLTQLSSFPIISPSIFELYIATWTQLLWLLMRDAFLDDIVHG